MRILCALSLCLAGLNLLAPAALADFETPLALTLSQVENLSRLRGDQAITARSEDIANAMLGQIILDLQAERGLIAMRGDSKSELTPLAHRSLKRPSGGSMTPVSQSFVLAPILQGVCGRYPETA